MGLIPWATTALLLTLAFFSLCLEHARSESLPGIDFGVVQDPFGVCGSVRDSAHQGCEADFKERTSPAREAQPLGRHKEEPKKAGLRVELKHRSAHPLHKATPFKDSLSHSLKRDVARTRGIGRRVGYAAIKALTIKADLGANPSSDVNAEPELRRHEDFLDEKVQHYMEFEGTVESGASVGSGEYFMDIFIGTPPRHIPVIIDTGSDLTWVQCDPCQHCYLQEGPVFQPRNSKSYGHVACASPECVLVDPYYNGSACGARSCSYFYWYGDFSNTTGDFAFETFTLNDSKGGPLQIEKVMFGCGHSNEGLFHGAGGLLGLGQGEVSFASQVGSLYGNKFSYCLVDRNNPLSVSSTIIFGEDEVLATARGLWFTPFVKNPLIDTFYYINISHLIVGGANLTIPTATWEIKHDGSGGTIIDSGTTLTYFMEPAYHAIRTAFASKITLPKVTRPIAPLDLCYDITGVATPVLPSLGIVFGNGAVWRLPQKNVFIQPDPDEETLCLAILGAPSSTMSIIGNYQQQNFHMVYDRANSQLGFAPMQCSSL